MLNIVILLTLSLYKKKITISFPHIFTEALLIRAPCSIRRKTTWWSVSLQPQRVYSCDVYVFEAARTVLSRIWIGEDSTE